MKSHTNLTTSLFISVASLLGTRHSSRHRELVSEMDQGPDFVELGHCCREDGQETAESVEHRKGILGVKVRACFKRGGSATLENSVKVP